MNRYIYIVLWLWTFACVVALAVAVATIADAADGGYSFAALFFQNFIVNLLVLAAATALLAAAFTLVSRMLRRGRPRYDVSVAGAGALLVYLTILVPVNVTFFPAWRSALSIILNALMLVLTLPFAAAIYIGMRWLSGALKPRRFIKAGYVTVALAVTLACAIWLAVIFWPRPNAGGPPAGEYNLIIITVDSLRRDYVSCYGVRTGTTPNIDRFAAKSVVFEEAYTAAPWTTPSMMSMLTGEYPSVHNCRLDTAASESLTLLPEVLRGYGYRTAAILAPSPPYMLGRELGFARGFDSYGLIGDFPGSHVFRGAALICGVRHVRSRLSPWLTGWGDTNPWVVGEVLSFLEGVPRDRPFFLWVHFLDPHFPYFPPEEYLATRGPDREEVDVFIRNDAWDLNTYTEDKAEILAWLYRGEVEYVDECLGRFLDKLEERGFLKNTVVVITADHGEEFYEHGKWGHGYQGPSHYVEVVGVPLVIYAPGFEPRRIADTNVSLVDLRPTALELLGLPPEDGLPGASLVPYMSGGRDSGRAVFADEALDYLTIKSVRRGGEVMVLSGAPRKAEVYDRQADPGEHNDLAGAEPTLARSLRAELDRWQTLSEFRLRGLAASRAVPVSGADREALRSLGYAK